MGNSYSGQHISQARIPRPRKSSPLARSHGEKCIDATTSFSDMENSPPQKPPIPSRENICLIAYHSNESHTPTVFPDLQHSAALKGSASIDKNKKKSRLSMQNLSTMFGGFSIQLGSKSPSSKCIPMRKYPKISGPVSVDRAQMTQPVTLLEGRNSAVENRLSLPPFPSRNYSEGPHTPTRMLSHPYARPNTIAFWGDINASGGSKTQPHRPVNLQPNSLTDAAAATTTAAFSFSPLDTPEVDSDGGSVFNPALSDHAALGIANQPTDSPLDDSCGLRQFNSIDRGYGRLRSLPGSRQLSRSLSHSLSLVSSGRPRSSRIHRSQRMATISGDTSLREEDDEAAAKAETTTTVPITCNLTYRPNSVDGQPALPFTDGTAYMMSSEQRLQVDQSLCTTKLLLHKLKRLLNENTGHLHVFTEQLDNCVPVTNGLTDGRTELYTRQPLARVSLHQQPPSAPQSPFFLLQTPISAPQTLEEALQEISRLRAENERLHRELAKTDGFAKKKRTSLMRTPLESPDPNGVLNAPS